MIAYFLSNISAKYYKNPSMLSRVIAKNVGDVFFETQCIFSIYAAKRPLNSANPTTTAKASFGIFWVPKICLVAILSDQKRRRTLTTHIFSSDLDGSHDTCPLPMATPLLLMIVHINVLGRGTRGTASLTFYAQDGFPNFFPGKGCIPSDSLLQST